jgi:hypothetical protein
MAQKRDRMDTNPIQVLRLMAPRKDDRLSLPAPGEWYDDLLTCDAWIANRSKPQQAQILLYSKLQEREARIFSRIAKLARKRNIEPEELEVLILAGTAKRVIVSGLEEAPSQEPEEEAEEEAEE